MRRADRQPLFARRQRRKEPVLVAVKIYPAAPGNMEARLHRLLWIELLKADAVHSRICHKANVVILGHGMIERDVPIVLDALDGKAWSASGSSAPGETSWSTAAKAAFSERVHNVSADRANVKDAFEHIACTVGVGPNVTSQKLSHAYAESLGQRLNEGNVGKAAAGFPLADGFIGHTKLSARARWVRPRSSRSCLMACAAKKVWEALVCRVWFMGCPIKLKKWSEPVRQSVSI